VSTMSTTSTRTTVQTGGSKGVELGKGSAADPLPVEAAA
jgi:hypothetical protein